MTMKKPTQCVLWIQPELGGQLYFFEFYEEIDWEGGNDPQYTTYIPVETNEEIETLKKSSPLELLQFFPRLQIDFPKEAKEPKVWWNGK